MLGTTRLFRAERWVCASAGWMSKLPITFFAQKEQCFAGTARGAQSELALTETCSL